jgi:hypothetical protein
MMSETKPPRRLVGWKQYIGNIAVRVLGRSVARALLAGGLLSFGFSIFVFAILSFNADLNAHPIPIGFAPRYLVGGGLLGGLCMLGLWSAKVLLKRVEKIEPVGLITRHNTGNLPEVETLVRGSDIPVVVQQAELLRAAGQGLETPPEQLLRAGEEKRQDV